MVSGAFVLLRCVREDLIAFQRVRVDALLADLVAKYPQNATSDATHAPKLGTFASALTWKIVSLDKDETASVANSTTSRARTDTDAKRQRL